MERPQAFGPYEVGNTVGRGTFAKVKEAIHMKTRTKVALKIIPRRVVDEDPKSQVKIKREIRILQMLRHRHIMRLYDVVQTRHDIILVLEHVSGGELFDYILKCKRLQEKVARRFFQQIVCAVYHCHLHNVAHRDIKPENIMLDSLCQTIKIGDFGLSSIIRDGKLFETSCGTPNYAAPEVVTGKLYSGREADVWSCGVVLYTMLSGSLPFDETVPQMLFSKICNGVYPRHGYFSQGATEIIALMLNVDPLHRVTVQQLLEHPWVREDFPDYLVQTTTQSLYQSQQFASVIKVTNALDKDIIQDLASVYHRTPDEIRHIVAKNEFDNSVSLKLRADTLGSSAYFAESNSVVDDLIQPVPLLIPSADEKLRSAEHEIWISYNMVTARRSTDNSNGIGGSLRMMPVSSKSSHQDPYNAGHSSSFIGSLRGVSLGPQSHMSHSTAHQTTEGGLHRAGGMSLMPQTSSSLSQRSGDSASFVDVYVEGYKQPVLVQPLLLHSNREGVTGTVLGSLFNLKECSAEFAPSGNPSAAVVVPSQPVPHPISEGRRLLKPKGPPSEGGSSQQSQSVFNTHDVRSRFGNDFMRNGVMFFFANAELVLHKTMAALRNCGFTCRPLASPFTVAAIRHPDTKLIVKMFKVSSETYLVDVRVSNQCGFRALTGALEVLEQLERESQKGRR